MTEKAYERATELRKTKSHLDKIRHIMGFPYPELNIFKYVFGFSYEQKGLRVDFVDLDEETNLELKEAILNVVSKRKREIEEELEKL